MKIYASALISLLGLNTHGLAADNFPKLDGNWISSSCELRPQQSAEGLAPWYLKRNITFSANQIDAHFTTYIDPECSTPLLELKFGGDVQVKGHSEVAPGAMEVDLIVNQYLSITPQAEPFAGFLNSAEAGDCATEQWQVGVEQNVYDTGCSIMGLQANTPSEEFEVLYVEGGRLYFGARPIDGKPLDSPESRPTALQVPLKLANGGLTQRVGQDDVRRPTAVEIVMFEQQADASPDDVRTFFENITLKMNSNDTLLYRTVAQGPGLQWLCINYWTSLEDMQALNTQAKQWRDEFSAMARLAKPDSFQLTSYRINYP